MISLGEGNFIDSQRRCSVLSRAARECEALSDARGNGIDHHRIMPR